MLPALEEAVLELQCCPENARSNGLQAYSVWWPIVLVPLSTYTAFPSREADLLPAAGTAVEYPKYAIHWCIAHEGSRERNDCFHAITLEYSRSTALYSIAAG